MAAQTVVMPKKKATTGAPSDRRKPFRMIRVREVIAAIGEERAAELAQDFTQYVNDAVRMRLEAEGKWPPPPPRGRPA